MTDVIEAARDVRAHAPDADDADRASNLSHKRHLKIG
jgi:hypothetical protein